MSGRIAIEGTHNFRDIGGYPARGGRTRSGPLLRSDSLATLTPAGLARLSEMGIGVIVDLRSPLELSQDHSVLDLPEAVRVSVPIVGGSRSYIVEDGHISLEKLYWEVLVQSGWSLAAAVSIIGESGDAPVLIHCTAGKDRTGLVVALALEAAGVQREAVVADYTQSALNLDGPWMERTLTELVSRGVPISPSLFEVLGGSPDHAMSRLLARVDQSCGSVAGYLIAHGLQEPSLELLRRKLVTSGG